jgi:hypothetical protein
VLCIETVARRPLISCTAVAWRPDWLSCGDGGEEATHWLLSGSAKAATLLHGDNNKYAVHWLCGGNTEGVGYTVTILRRPHMDYVMMDDRWHQHCGRAHRDEVVQRIRGHVQAVECFPLW